ncbi:MAG: coproporphyrinogen-III oxidase family protein [Nanoarchaeota archaeon]|nr:coproporphyrinogen III oxidase family protein [Nanoarchaeota archaeon]MBU1030181.1 coproporphyrinogen III oxidase family protein [Nanoarchaeota archaeon]MBU1849571.1 coproporphyrinogen III oxidase family protein [Nanoarchaeota archaeon]
MKSIKLAEKVNRFEFHPEVYVYPTPRVYKKVDDFSLKKAKFSRELNLYIHIPFCKQICSYCGYLKIVDQGELLRKKYVDFLLKEIDMYRDVLKNRIIKTLHFGGGTPSLLSSSELGRIISALLNINPAILNTADEISIEATPSSVEYEKFREFMRLGINRVSLGLQTFDNSEVKLCGRNNFSDVSINAIKTLRKLKVPNLVLDLMIGIEGQTVESFERSVKAVLELKPETVELYALGLMPNTHLQARKKNLMSAPNIYRCYDLGRKLFLDAGYIQDCHNRYVIPEKGSFLQEDYVFSGMSLIGFGAGARTYAENVHYRNSCNSQNCKKAITEYFDSLSLGILPVKSCFFLNQEEKLRQYVIYNIESFDKKDFQRRFDICFEDIFLGFHDVLYNLGLAEEKSGVVCLTSRGLDFRDLIANQFFSNKVLLAEKEYRLG